MSLQICEGCGGAYSVGAPRCPQCGSTEFHENYEVEPIRDAPVQPVSPSEAVSEPADAVLAPDEDEVTP